MFVDQITMDHILARINPTSGLGNTANAAVHLLKMARDLLFDVFFTEVLKFNKGMKDAADQLTAIAQNTGNRGKIHQFNAWVQYNKEGGPWLWRCGSQEWTEDDLH